MPLSRLSVLAVALACVGAVCAANESPHDYSTYAQGIPGALQNVLYKIGACKCEHCAMNCQTTVDTTGPVPREIVEKEFVEPAWPKKTKDPCSKIPTQTQCDANEGSGGVKCAWCWIRDGSPHGPSRCFTYAESRKLPFPANCDKADRTVADVADAKAPVPPPPPVKQCDSYGSQNPCNLSGRCRWCGWQECKYGCGAMECGGCKTVNGCLDINDSCSDKGCGDRCDGRRRRRRRRKLSAFLEAMRAKPKTLPVTGFPPEPASCIAELQKVCGQCFKGDSSDMGCLKKCGYAHIPELVKAGCKKPA